VIRLRPARVPLVVAYMAGIFLLSALPGSMLAEFGLRAGTADALHVPLYAGLALVTLLSLEGLLWFRIGIATAVCLVFALSDEWHQSFVPGRRFSMGDLGADALGTALGIGLREAWRVVRPIGREGPGGAGP